MGFGVLLIAVRARAYGEMAVNLAMTLKAYCPDIAICCISDGTLESTGQADLFDKIITVDRGVNPFLLKTRLNNLTPFEKTLYIDADTVCVSDPGSCFALLDSVTFAMMHYRNHSSESVGDVLWADLSEIYSHYELPKDSIYPECNSSLIYWVQSDSADKYFDMVQKAYDFPCKLIQDVGGFFPDEVAFGSASAKLDFQPEIQFWQPAYLQHAKAVLDEKEIKANYPFLTRSGARPNDYIDRIMNSSASKAGQILGRKYYKFDITKKIHA